MKHFCRKRVTFRATEDPQKTQKSTTELFSAIEGILSGIEAASAADFIASTAVPVLKFDAPYGIFEVYRYCTAIVPLLYRFCTAIIPGIYVYI